jgi:multidrug efflux pump subunit AcrA (membrane-fusion protein)
MRYVVMLLGGLWLGFSAEALNAGDPAKLDNCEIVLDQQAEIPAQEAGVLMKIPVREGQAVEEGQLLGQIDDEIPVLKEMVATHKLNVANKQATDTADFDFASAGYKVANHEWERAKASNRKIEGAVPDAEVVRLELEATKMYLSIEKATKDLTVAKLQAQVAEAELAGAKADIRRRRITAPFNAIVVELTGHVGEWVQAGQTVMKLVRVDRLKVNGSLDAKKYRQADIEGRPVQVVVSLPDNQEETFNGKIVYVKPLVEGGEFQVRAEIENRRRGNGWAIYPGMSAKMTIDLK